MIRFERNFILAFFILVALVPILETFLYRRQAALIDRFGQRSLVISFSRVTSRRKRIACAVLLALIVGSLVLAAAGPYRSGGNTYQDIKFFPHLAVIDTSRSMDVEDYGRGKSRLDMVRAELLALYDKYQDGIAGIETYASESNLQGDLTTDIGALRFIAENWVRVGSAPGSGSNIPRGLAAATVALERYNQTHRNQVGTIVLFSDGGSEEVSKLQEVLSRISKKQFKLIVVGVGSLSGGRVPLRDEFGKIIGYYLQGGIPATSKLNEGLLERIAKKVGGDYVRLSSGGELVSIASSHLESMTAKANQKQSVAKYFIIFALLALTGYIVTNKLNF